MFHFRKASLPTVTFATTVWEKDWRSVLLSPDYLRVLQIQNHQFPFAEKLLVINNVTDLETVRSVASQLIATGVLTRFVIAGKIAQEVMSFFQLQRSDFRVGDDAGLYEGVNPDWIYYNALGPLCAIYECRSEYLLYLTGDVRMDQPVNWIEAALRAMQNNPTYKVAGLVWNGRYAEAKSESYRKEGSFYVAKAGFSDQLFLAKTETLRQPIYGEIRTDAAHFPRGDVFEKRVFSSMKNRGWERIIFRRGSYTHENF